MVEGVIIVQDVKYRALLDAVEDFVKNAIGVQITDESDSDYGGFRCPDHLICEHWSAVNTFATMVVLFVNHNSQYYRSESLLQRIKMALRFIMMDIYFSGEMITTSNLAHILNSLLKSYRLLLRDNHEGEILPLLESFLTKCADSLKSCVADTPTQRLAIASGLIDYDKQFFDDSAVSKAQTYLSDRVDINHDGMYGYKSFNQSMLSNTMLLNIAKKINKPYMIDYVRRNLNFTLYNILPNGESILDCSLDTMQESPFGYAVWKGMSIIDHNGYYATVGDILLERFLGSIKDGYAHCYTEDTELEIVCRDYSRFFLTSSIGEFLIVEEELKNDAVHRLPLPSNYEKTFSESNIVRIKKGKMNATITGNNSTIFSMVNGQVAIQHIKVGYNCYGRHYFEPKKLEVNAGVYILRLKSDSDSIDPSKANLIIKTEFRHKPNCFEINISADGIKGVPFFLEFGIKRHGKLFINDRELDMADVGMVSMDSGEAVVKSGDDSITIRGGMIQHRIYRSEDVWTKNLKTASIMITPITPFSSKILIIWE
jgi:hypothetical protein